MRARVGVVALAMCALIACGGGSAKTASVSSSTTSKQPLAAGQEGSRSDVPWDQVGPGWLLAMWATSAPSADPSSAPPTTPSDQTKLFLVDPAGGRYLITSMTPKDAEKLGTLVDWSGDGHRALFVGSAGTDAVKAHITEVEIGTGDVNAFDIEGSSTKAGYTRPQGKAIVVSIPGSGLSATTKRFDPSGSFQLSYPTRFPVVGDTTEGFLESPDGTDIVLAATKGIVTVDNSGGHPHELPIRGADDSCKPLRWWDQATVLASCGTTARLWLVNTTGAAPTALTAPLSGSGQDLGDLDAWKVGGTTYVQDAGACGYQYLAKLGSNGVTSPVAVPGVQDGDSVFVKGAHGSQLALVSAFSCGEAKSLVWFDPSTNKVTPLLGAPVNGGSVSDAVLFREP